MEPHNGLLAADWKGRDAHVVEAMSSPRYGSFPSASRGADKAGSPSRPIAPVAGAPAAGRDSRDRSQSPSLS